MWDRSEKVDNVANKYWCVLQGSGVMKMIRNLAIRTVKILILCCKYVLSYPERGSIEFNKIVQILPTKQSIDQAINQLTNQPVDQEINQSTNQPTNQPNDHSIDQPTKHTRKQTTNQSTNEQTS